MVSNKKPSTKLGQKNAQASTIAGTRLQKGDWLILPLGILAALCFYVFTSSLSGLGYLAQSPLGVLNQPVLFALLMGIFSVWFIYKILRRSVRPLVSKIAAYTLSIALILVLLWVAVGSGQPCTGLFGVQTDCSNVYYFKIWLALFNPYVGSALSLLSIAGIISFFQSASKK